MKIFFSKKVSHRLSKSLRERLEFNYIVIIILALLLGLFIFSLINLLTVFRLRQEWQTVQSGIVSSAEASPMRYYEAPADKIIVPDAVNIQTGSSSTEILTETPTETPIEIPASPTPVIDPVVVTSQTEITKTSETPETKTSITPKTSEVLKPSSIDNRSGWKYNVFGDGFSNSYYVDMSKTNFRYDDMATSFSFVPAYEKRDNGACSQVSCGFSETPKTQYCLAKNSQLCVSWDGEKLNYNNDEIKDFTTLFSGYGGKPDRVSIFSLANYWLVGAVWTENGQEIGRAWRFDGKKLVILDPENRVPFVTRQGYGGSNIYFGGDDSNYIVLYSGYDFIGYQVVNNTLWNITDFFNTRLAENGFTPQIIKHQQGAETIWYICSLTEDKPKLIKMWQNGSKIIRGLLSLGEEFFSGEYTSAICREGSDGYLEIATAKKNGGAVSYNKWSLIDKGFDQSHNYQAISVNLSSSKGIMKMANFSGLSLCGADSCGSGALKDGLSFSIANNSNNWQTTTIGQEHLFTGSGSSLLWKFQASSDSNKSYYSPWFGAINSVYYAWVE